MGLLHIVGLFLAGVLAAASFIVSKKPDAQEWINKLRPYQGIVGVVVLGLGVFSLIDGNLGFAFKAMKYKFLLGLTGVSLITCEVLLGFLLGMPQIAEWIPGESEAETKAVEWSKKLGPYQVTMGLIAIATSVLALFFYLTR